MSSTRVVDVLWWYHGAKPMIFACLVIVKLIQQRTQRDPWAKWLCFMGWWFSSWERLTEHYGFFVWGFNWSAQANSARGLIFGYSLADEPEMSLLKLYSTPDQAWLSDLCWDWIVLRTAIQVATPPTVEVCMKKRFSKSMTVWWFWLNTCSCSVVQLLRYRYWRMFSIFLSPVQAGVSRRDLRMEASQASSRLIISNSGVQSSSNAAWLGP